MTAVLYAETSAVLRWILRAPDGAQILDLLAGAETVIASRLTLVEARRALARAAALGEIGDADAAEAQGALAQAAPRWTIVELVPEVLERAGQRFAVEPVRTLDAIHLATAGMLVPMTPSLAVLSTDERIRRNAVMLGCQLLPA